MSKKVVTFGELMIRLQPITTSVLFRPTIWVYLRRRRGQRGCVPGQLRNRRFLSVTAARPCHRARRL